MNSYIRTYKIIFILVYDHETGELLALGTIMDVCRKLDMSVIELAELLIATKHDYERYCDVDYFTEEITDAESVLETAEYLNTFVDVGFDLGRTEDFEDENIDF